MPQLLKAATDLKDRFWEPYLPYGVTATQKLYEDVKYVSYAHDRVSSILEILDRSIAEDGIDTTQSDLFQGLKLLLYQGALPFDKAGDGAPCIVKAMQKRGYSSNLTQMVGALCVSSLDENVSAAAQKRWAEKTYTRRYADIASDNPVEEAKPDTSKKTAFCCVGQNAGSISKP